MNKALHVLVYVFLALAAAALYFELQLNAKRAELTDRNRMQEDYLVKIARTIEKSAPAKDTSAEVKKDVSVVGAKLEDSPEMENVLGDYDVSLEEANLDTLNWESQREQLRNVYMLDENGKPVMDGNKPLAKGPGTEDELLGKLFDGAKAQQSRLNTTRAALADLRGKLEAAVAEINKLKPDARQDKVTIAELNAKVATFEGEKADLEGQVTKTKAQVKELNAEITSLKDEITTAKDETEAAKEEIAKGQKLIEQLKKLVQESIQTQGAGSAAAGNGVAVSTLPAGDKGKVIDADNDNMFAIVKLSDEAMLELKGEKGDKMMAAMELGVKRTGFKGPAGEFVGRLRIRQEIKGKNYVICDILGNWEQAKLAVGDVIFAE